MRLQRDTDWYEVSDSENLDGWADDLKPRVEREIKDVDREIKEARRPGLSTVSLGAKLVAQKQIKSLESQRSQKRRSLFDAQDDVDKQRERLIAKIEGKLDQRVSNSVPFTVRWALR